MACQMVKPAELARARAKLYQILSALYFKPFEGDTLKLLAEWSAAQVEAANSWLLSQKTRQGLILLNAFFRNVAKKPWDKLQEDISIEFTRLFRGVKQHYSPLPPYESVYREESGRVFGETTADVQKNYRRFGFDLSDGLKNEPPDHLSFELEFMHLLCHQEAEARERNDEDEALRLLKAQKEFTEEHLLTWLPELCAKIGELDRLGFFHGVAELTEGWVTFDYQQNLSDI